MNHNPTIPLLRIGVPGCGGRVGRLLLKAILEANDLVLSGGPCRQGSEVEGTDLGRLANLAPIGQVANSERQALFADSQVIIDFTAAATLREHCQWAVAAGCALVVGSSGLSTADRATLHTAAATIPIVYAPNTSIGVAVLSTLVRRVAGLLGTEFDIEIVEMPHRNKKDAPSGTALHLGEQAAEGRQIPFAKHAVRARDGMTGPRRDGDIGFATLRGGSVVAEHSVIFAGPSERLVLSHIAEQRDLFAYGALYAARWLRDRAPGIYSMEDVLGLR